MFERYTESARRTLFFARYEASQTGSRTIETEHVLLGLLREVRGIVAAVFEGAHVSADEIRRDLNQRVAFGETFPTSVEIPFSAATMRVLQRAAHDADELGHSYIGTEHLLLGLLAEKDDSIAASVLAERGVRLADARDVILASGHEAAEVAAGGAALMYGDVHARIATLKRLVAELLRISRDSPDARAVVEKIDEELDALRAIFD